MMSNATNIFLLIFSVTLVSFELTFTGTITLTQNEHILRLKVSFVFEQVNIYQAHDSKSKNK